MVRTLDSHPKAIPWVLGKPFYVVTDPHAECEVRMDHVAGPSHNLLAEKEGRIWFYIICLTLYQFERTTWWCLSVLESIIGISLESALKSFLLKKCLKKSWSPGICVMPTSWRWTWRKFRETTKPYPSCHGDFMYGSPYTGHDGDEGVYFPSSALERVH